MEHTAAEVNAIINGRPASEIDNIIDEYIHDARNREIAKRKILNGMAYEPLSEAFGITPRHCFNIVKAAKRIIVDHIKT